LQQSSQFKLLFVTFQKVCSNIYKSSLHLLYCRIIAEILSDLACICYIGERLQQYC